MKEEESTAIPIEDEDDPSSTLLDLTSYQLHDLDLVELPPNLTANRLSLLDPHIGNLSHLKKLSHCENLAVVPLSFPKTSSPLSRLLPLTCEILVRMQGIQRIDPRSYASSMDFLLWNAKKCLEISTVLAVLREYPLVSCFSTLSVSRCSLDTRILHNKGNQTRHIINTRHKQPHYSSTSGLEKNQAAQEKSIEENTWKGYKLPFSQA
ncbi:hypothetical protein JHK82_012378 [Glycine max]|nr:hypothetical protein JHK85_012729 [Glycine max]KAG5057400.1 hypothetical protein JHK86_012396 [Glycine max]KAG5154409.1 hypothetical protein JHK82_012378 [Glycine max]